MKTIQKTQTTQIKAQGGVSKMRKFKKMFAVLLLVAIMVSALTVVTSAAAPAPSTAESTYKTVIEFFITWLTRIGMLVGLVGAIMFALAIKSNDAEQKQAGLLTMVAGFVVAAVCGAANMFNLFT